MWLAGVLSTNMAASPCTHYDDSYSGMEEHLTCVICYNLLREPRTLDCPHVFCLECLQKWVRDEQIVECPECRRITMVPQGGVVNLNVNLHLKNLVKEYSDHIEKQKGSPICPNHEGERQHFYCVTCHVTVCRACLVLNHERPRHEIKELKAITKTLKAEVEGKMKRVTDEIKRGEGEHEELEDAVRKIEAAKRKAVKDIDRQSQHIIAAVKAKKKEMVRRVDKTCEEYKKLLLEKQNRTKDKITRLQNIQIATHQVIDSSADHIYMQRHESLVDKIDKLSIIHYKTPPDLRSLQFKPGTDPMKFKWFGDAMIHGNKICGLRHMKTFGEFQVAQGIAVTPSGLLAIVDCKAKDVIIHKHEDGEYAFQFSLGGNITEPFYIAAMSDGRFLVTYQGGILKIFSADGKHEKALTGCGDVITTTPDDMIVTGNSETGVITVHHPDGELIRKHQVDCRRMRGIASNGQQIVITSLDVGRREHNTVCVIDFITGKVQGSIDMTLPLGICYEPMTKTVLVAGGSMRPGQGVIDQRCSTTGRLISRIASGLCAPLAMCVSQNSKLVVADYKTVKVYAII